MTKGRVRELVKEGFSDNLAILDLRTIVDRAISNAERGGLEPSKIIETIEKVVSKYKQEQSRQEYIKNGPPF